ncbi:MAG: DegV family EDD domain-containing protein [Oscillospiraceae bacterium]|jgi:DegV family protein with EDD domain|nr:DegV family EDD domain-containing protein [Oscillospiraceae bacterium]
MPYPYTISTDSPADLPEDLRLKYEIPFVELYVVMEGTGYKDKTGITPEQIFDYYHSTKKIPTTSAVPIGDYLDFFRGLKAENGNAPIVHFTIGGKISCSYQNAVEASKEFEEVYVIDSESMSIGIGLLLLWSAGERDKGISAKDLAAAAELKKKKVRTTALLGEITYMKHSGRVTSVQAMGANMLGIRPVLGMTDGILGQVRKLRGKAQELRRQYIDFLLEEPAKIDTSICMLAHTSIPPEDFETAEEQVRSLDIFKQMYTMQAGSVLSVHIGDGCLVFMYFLK